MEAKVSVYTSSKFSQNLVFVELGVERFSQGGTELCELSVLVSVKYDEEKVIVKATRARLSFHDFVPDYNELAEVCQEAVAAAKQLLFTGDRDDSAAVSQIRSEEFPHVKCDYGPSLGLN